MTPTNLVRLGNSFFKSKSDIKKHCQFLIKKYADREVIRGDDDLFLRDLIKSHENCDQKTGVGIKLFSVRTDPRWKNSRHFMIVRTDRSYTDFSYLSCLNGNNHRQDVIAGMRHAILNQIMDFRISFFNANPVTVCPYLGTVLTQSNSHVDHIAPDTFIELANRWMRESGLTPSDMPLAPHGDNATTIELANKEQERSWQEYHKCNAKLRIISAEANTKWQKHQSPKSP